MEREKGPTRRMKGRLQGIEEGRFSSGLKVTRPRGSGKVLRHRTQTAESA